VVVLDGPAQVMSVLEGSWRTQLRRIDVLVVADGRSREAAHALEEQLEVRRRMEVDADEPAPSEGTGALTGGSGAACRLTR
jgi:hypothetical protein